MKAQVYILIACLLLAAACGGSDLTNERSTAGSTSGGAPTGSSDPTNASQVAEAQNKVVITSEIDVEVEHIRETYIQIVDMTRRFGGYVALGSISDSGEHAGASLRVRLPATRHEEMLASLRNIDGATVKGERTNAKEVTAEFTDLQSRISNLRRSEAQYQELLSRATSIADIIQVTSRLDEVRGQIEQAQGRLNLLTDQVDFATIGVSLTVPSPSAKSNIAKPLEVLNDALEASLVVALVSVNVLIVGIVAALWLLPASLITLLAWRLLGSPIKAIYAKLASW